MGSRIITIARGTDGCRAIERRLRELEIESRDIGGFRHIFGVMGGFGLAFPVALFSSGLPSERVGSAVLAGIGAVALGDAVRIFHITKPTRVAAARVRKRYEELTNYATPEVNPNYDKDLESILADLNSIPIPDYLVKNGDLDRIAFQFIPITE